MKIREESALLALLAATLLASVAFFTIVQPFLIALLLAGITAALAEPLRDKVLTRVEDRRYLASAITLALLSVAVILPILGVVALAAAQAQFLFSDVSSLDIEELGDFRTVPDWMPFQDTLSAHWTTITEKAEELASDLAGVFTGFCRATGGRDRAVSAEPLYLRLRRIRVPGDAHTDPGAAAGL